jgi:hypothetical protein
MDRWSTRGLTRLARAGILASFLLGSTGVLALSSALSPQHQQAATSAADFLSGGADLA